MVRSEADTTGAFVVPVHVDLTKVGLQIEMFARDIG
jgi:hypothetical protein